MIITYSKSIIINNIVSLTNKKIDALVTGSKVDSSTYYLTEDNLSWIEKTLIIADYQVRKVLLHLLSNEITNADKSTLVYNLILSHPLQQEIIPQLIEESLIDYVRQTWMADKTIIPSPNTINVLIELKSVSLMAKKRAHRTYHIF